MFQTRGHNGKPKLPWHEYEPTCTALKRCQVNIPLEYFSNSIFSQSLLSMHRYINKLERNELISDLYSTIRQLVH